MTGGFGFFLTSEYVGALGMAVKRGLVKSSGISEYITIDNVE